MAPLWVRWHCQHRVAARAISAGGVSGHSTRCRAIAAATRHGPHLQLAPFGAATKDASYYHRMHSSSQYYRTAYHRRHPQLHPLSNRVSCSCGNFHTSSPRPTGMTAAPASETALSAPAPPGALACQKDSSLRELSTRVHAIAPLAEPAGAFAIELEDTVLFPEGGGQPWDTGRLNGTLAVDRVYVQSGRCLHRVVTSDGVAPLAVGDAVHVEVDWDRRFDHMQQHSGQHLLSAVCEKYGYDTTTWSMGDERCNIELVPFAWNEAAKQSKDKVVPPSVLQQIEADVNAAIVSGKSMLPKFVAQGEPEWEKIASKFAEGERPAALRIVVIDGLDANPCCGTHVQSLAHLQSLRLLNTEYARGATRVWFVVGNRVNREFTRMFQREQQLTKLLSCAPDDHAARVEKLQLAQRTALKEIKALQKEVAVAVAAELLVKKDAEQLRVVHCHRSDADLPFLQSVLAILGDAKQSTVFVLTAGDAKGDGSFVLAGPSDLVAQHGKSVIEVIDGKGGGGKGGVLQGKAKSLNKVGDLVARLQELQLAQ